uniref:Uncharacterized protein n=1 Tax=Ixodes ricinus TaxID=34613 RepID=A0A6B0V309_IXORI
MLPLPLPASALCHLADCLRAAAIPRRPPLHQQFQDADPRVLVQGSRGKAHLWLRRKTAAGKRDTAPEAQFVGTGPPAPRRTPRRPVRPLLLGRHSGAAPVAPRALLCGFGRPPAITPARPMPSGPAPRRALPNGDSPLVSARARLVQRNGTELRFCAACRRRVASAGESAFRDEDHIPCNNATHLPFVFVSCSFGGGLLGCLPKMRST